MRRIVKNSEEESKLDSKKYSKNKDQIKNGHNGYDTKKNHLKYYNEIASRNLHEKMDFPTLKEIERITRDESCLDIFKSKEKEKSKDLPKILDDLPLKRVERMTFKSKEIGHMRRALGEYCLNNPFVYINKEKGEKLAQTIFEKRQKRRDKKEIGIFIDVLYGESKFSPRKNNTLSNLAKNQSWIKKYKTIGHEESEKRIAETNENINMKNSKNNIKTNKRLNSTINERRNDNKNTNNIYFNIKSNENKSIYNNKNIKISNSQGRRRNLNLFENPGKENKSNIFTNSNSEIKRREYKTINVKEEKEKDKDINKPSYNTNNVYNNNRRNHQINSRKKGNIQESQNENMYLKYKVNTSNIFNQRNKAIKNDGNNERKKESFVLRNINMHSNYDLNKMVIPERGNNKNNVAQKRDRGDSQIELNVKKYEKKDGKNNIKVSYFSSNFKVNNKL